LEGSKPHKFLARNGLQGHKSQKTEKTPEKVLFFSLGPPGFLPNRVISGPFLIVKLLNDLQMIIQEELAKTEK
jgi:hypothetical protein